MEISAPIVVWVDVVVLHLLAMLQYLPFVGHHSWDKNRVVYMKTQQVSHHDKKNNEPEESRGWFHTTSS